MKWTCWIAALILCCGSVNADAGLFSSFGKGHGCHQDDSCCPTCAAPAECCPEPTCCAPAECCPAPTCCAPAAPECCAPQACHNECCPTAPSCCAPAECCPAEPTCCAPTECCDNACAPSYHCAPKKKGCLSRLFGIFKGKGGCHSNSCHQDSCCPEPSCCAPTCAAPCH